MTPPTTPDVAALAALGMAVPAVPSEAMLYMRYLRALALLCECRPYLDEPDYAALIDDLLVDAAAHYPLDIDCDGDRRAIAPRSAAHG